MQRIYMFLTFSMFTACVEGGNSTGDGWSNPPGCESCPAEGELVSTLVAATAATSKWNVATGRVDLIQPTAELPGVNFTLTNGAETFEGETSTVLDLSPGEWSASFNYEDGDGILCTGETEANIGNETEEEIIAALVPVDLIGTWRCNTFLDDGTYLAELDPRTINPDEDIIFPGTGVIHPQGTTLFIEQPEGGLYPADQFLGKMVSPTEVNFHVGEDNDIYASFYCEKL